MIKRSSSVVDRLKPFIPWLTIYDFDKINLDEFFKVNSFDGIIHCATEYGRKNTSWIKIIEANLIFPLNLIKAAINSGVSIFINIDTMLSPNVSKYSLSKHQFRQWLELLSEDIHVSNIRMEHFYGPGDDESKFVSYIVRSLIKNVNEIPLTEGYQKRDFVYIEDAVRAIITVMQNAFLKKNKGFFECELGSGFSVSIREMVELAKAVSGNGITTLKFGALPYRKTEDMKLEVNLREMRNLGWSPQYSLRDGLEKMISRERVLL